jgi:hypothetical protein
MDKVQKKETLSQIIKHHRQNPLDFIYKIKPIPFGLPLTCMVKSVCILRSNSLGWGSATFSLQRAALVIYTFAESRRKN